MRYFLLCSFLAILTSCTSDQPSSKPVPEATAQTRKSLNSEVFNQSFSELLVNYYSLKDNFIAENDAAIAQIARNMLVSADSLKLSELKADSVTIALANTYTMGISSEIKGLLGETSISEKRKEFQLVGDQLYDLIKTVRYDKEKVYHIFCATAFNDQGAFWLSKSADIRNPYIPKKMIACGEIKDSFDLRPGS